MIAFHLPSDDKALTNGHFDDQEEAAQDSSWRRRHTEGSVFAEDYQDERDYSTIACCMMKYVASMFPRKFFPVGTWKKPKPSWQKSIGRQ